MKSAIRTMSVRFLVLLLVAPVSLLPACGDSPTSSVEHARQYPPQPWSWVEVDSFVEGGRIGSLFGTGPGNVYAASRNIKRRGDGWSILPGGAVARYDGSSWSEPLYEIGETIGFEVDLWASSPDDIYLADGRLRHFDGSAWRNEGIDADVVYGTGENDVFAATDTDGGIIYHYNGTDWNVIRELDSDDRVTAIHAIPGPFVAVAFEHSVHLWDGSAWTDTEFLFYEYIEALWAFGPGDVYAIGDGYPEPRVWHWDGVEWTEMTVPAGGSLVGVWGIAPDDIYACGRNGTLMHYNGVEWRRVELNTCKGLWAVWASGPDDVYVAGDNELVMHYDGTTWRSIRKRSPDRPAAIWAESPRRYVIASGLDAGTLYINDNGEWTEHYIAGTRYSGIRSMAGSGIDDLHVLIDRTTWHFDGSTWTQTGFLDADYPGTMWFASPTEGHAIGGESIFHYNGFRWERVVSGLGWSMRGLYGASADAVYAIHGDGTVFFFNGAQWDTIPSPVPPGGSLVSIGGVSADEVYVVAGAGNTPLGSGGIFRWDGERWSQIPSPDNIYLSEIVVGDTDNIFLYYGCWLGHFNGAVWSVECHPDSPPGQIIEALDGTILQGTGQRLLRQSYR